MIFRFSLYGFLKNQRYFEPFLILFFLDKGLSFSEIGLLIGFKELFKNITEIPSGSFADLYGRRSSIILSFSAYIISFLIFWYYSSFYVFFAAMLFYAVGDAFRTGTHKAIIFSWLREQDRMNEKTKVYGFTRSWSKIGSAVSIILATIFILIKPNYDKLFLYALIPYVFGLLNIVTYPKRFDNKNKELDLKLFFSHFKNSIKKSLTVKPLRRLIAESMSFEGCFAAIKDYIQPVIKSMALSVPIFLAYEDKARTALFVGLVYFVIYIFSAVASRKSHFISDKTGDENKGTKLVWKLILVTYVLLIPLLYFKYYVLAIVLFIGLNLLQNFWRPMQVSRFDNFATEEEGAAILSVESQAKTFATMIFAPIFGFLVDLNIEHGFGGDFWPIALISAFSAVYFAFGKTVKEKYSEVSS